MHTSLLLYIILVNVLMRNTMITYNSSKDVFLVLLLEENQQISQQESQHICEWT